MRHVLLVEDDTINAMVIRAVLEKRAGLRVTVTEQAAEVLRLCHAGEVDLVIMDISLTNTQWEGRPVTGVDLCKLLKSDPATARVPVLLATAHAMRGDAEKLLSVSGAEGYVAKPIVDHLQFVQQVKDLLPRAA